MSLKIIAPPSDVEYKQANLRLRLDRAPPTYACMKCGWPVIKGFCCETCGDTNPSEPPQQPLNVYKFAVVYTQTVWHEAEALDTTAAKDLIKEQLEQGQDPIDTGPRICQSITCDFAYNTATGRIVDF